MLNTKTISAPKNELGKLKILLAEDNEINQLLAKSILHFWGFESKVATTGYEVIDLIENEDFDVILMDIQMPEKDGIEATEEIRNLTDLKKKNIPIIALTANALKGEEKKYIQVGMDDFLTKPFKQNDLYDVISRVLNNKGSFGRKINNHKNSISVIYPDPSVKLYNLSLLNDIARGNDEFLISLTKIFVETIPPTSTQLKEACMNEEWDNASKLAHKLKSTIDSLQISSIKEDVRFIELNAKKLEHLSELSEIADKIEWVITKVTLQLKEEFPLLN